MGGDARFARGLLACGSVFATAETRSYAEFASPAARVLEYGLRGFATRLPSAVGARIWHGLAGRFSRYYLRSQRLHLSPAPIAIGGDRCVP